MNATERRQHDYARHKAWLEKFTGWNFGPPALDKEKGVVFWTVQTVRVDGAVKPLALGSIVSDHADLLQ